MWPSKPKIFTWPICLPTPDLTNGLDFFLPLSKKLINELPTHNPHARVWMSVFHQNFSVEMLLRESDETLGRWQGHDSGALMNGVSALTVLRLRRDLGPFMIWGHSKKVMALNQKEGPHRREPRQCPNLALQISVVDKNCAVCDVLL